MSYDKSYSPIATGKTVIYASNRPGQTNANHSAKWRLLPLCQCSIHKQSDVVLRQHTSHVCVAHPLCTSDMLVHGAGGMQG